MGRLGKDYILQFPFLPSKYAPEGHNLYDFLIFSDSMHTHTGIEDIRIVNTLNHYFLGYTYESDPQDEYANNFKKEVKVRRLSLVNTRYLSFPPWIKYVNNLEHRQVSSHEKRGKHKLRSSLGLRFMLSPLP